MGIEVGDDPLGGAGGVEGRVVVEGDVVVRIQVGGDEVSPLDQAGRRFEPNDGNVHFRPLVLDGNIRAIVHQQDADGGVALGFQIVDREIQVFMAILRGDSDPDPIFFFRITHLFLHFVLEFQKVNLLGNADL